MNWKHRIGLKHLLTEDEDYESIQNAMNGIADLLQKECCFEGFTIVEKFRKLPRGDGAVNFANSLLDQMYDYADENCIWID